MSKITRIQKQYGEGVKIKVSRNEFAIIDEEDLEKVNLFVWRIWRRSTYRGGEKFYRRDICTHVKVDGVLKKLLLARYLTDCPPGKRVFHLNGRKLDFRKANLKVGSDRLFTPEESFARKWQLPDIFTLLNEAENGS
jgi:hypothetical protein